MDILESFISLVASRYKLTSQLYVTLFPPNSSGDGHFGGLQVSIFTPHPRETFPAKFFLVTDILESFVSLVASRYKYLHLIHVSFSRQILPALTDELRLPLWPLGILHPRLLVKREIAKSRA
jgi:hypothetical protein